MKTKNIIDNCICCDQSLKDKEYYDFVSDKLITVCRNCFEENNIILKNVGTYNCSLCEKTNIDIGSSVTVFSNLNSFYVNICNECYNKNIGYKEVFSTPEYKYTKENAIIPTAQSLTSYEKYMHDLIKDKNIKEIEKQNIIEGLQKIIK